MKQKSYKWLKRLVDKITKTDCPNNNYFWYYGHEVTLQSCQSDFMDVIIEDDESTICFDFDFYYKELNLQSYRDYDERDAIINAFRSVYGRIVIGYDEPWDDEEKLYLPIINNDDYDQENIMKEYNELLSRKVA